MKFTPDYNVSYKGQFYPAGKPFEIDKKDVAEMQHHGKVESASVETARQTTPKK